MPVASPQFSVSAFQRFSVPFLPIPMRETVFPQKTSYATLAFSARPRAVSARSQAVHAAFWSVSGPTDDHAPRFLPAQGPFQRIPMRQLPLLRRDQVSRGPHLAVSRHSMRRNRLLKVPSFCLKDRIHLLFETGLLLRRNDMRRKAQFHTFDPFARTNLA